MNFASTKSVPKYHKSWTETKQIQIRRILGYDTKLFPLTKS